METEAINWADDFTISENIADYASDIIGSYARISMAYPNHANVNEWNKEFEKWSEYYDNRFDHFYATEQEANNEVDRLLKVREEVLITFYSFF